MPNPKFYINPVRWWHHAKDRYYHYHEHAIIKAECLKEIRSYLRLNGHWLKLLFRNYDILSSIGLYDRDMADIDSQIQQKSGDIKTSRRHLRETRVQLADELGVDYPSQVESEAGDGDDDLVTEHEESMQPDINFPGVPTTDLHDHRLDEGVNASLRTWTTDNNPEKRNRVLPKAKPVQPFNYKGANSKLHPKISLAKAKLMAFIAVLAEYIIIVTVMINGLRLSDVNVLGLFTISKAWFAGTVILAVAEALSWMLQQQVEPYLLDRTHKAKSWLWGCTFVVLLNVGLISTVSFFYLEQTHQLEQADQTKARAKEAGTKLQLVGPGSVEATELIHEKKTLEDQYNQERKEALRQPWYVTLIKLLALVILSLSTVFASAILKAIANILTPAQKLIQRQEHLAALILRQEKELAALVEKERRIFQTQCRILYKLALLDYHSVQDFLSGKNKTNP